MATTWLTKNAFSKHKWLLGNGEIVPEPLLEESSSGMRVRLAGSTQSRYRREEYEVVREGLRKIARQKQTFVWMPIDLEEHALRREIGFNPGDIPSAELSLDTGLGRKALAWWSFRHESLPIRAVLVVELRRVNATQFTVFARLVHPDTEPNDGRYPSIIVASDATPSVFDWASDILRTAEGKLLEREAVEALLKAVRAAEELDEITIPDLRVENEPQGLTLRLDEQNVNRRFIDDMKEYLDGAPAVEQVIEAYLQLVAALRGAGMVLPESLKENQLHAALTSGNKKALTIVLGKALGEEGEDRLHAVSVHLPTGTFVVTCTAKTDKDKVAQAWEESKLLATLTGQEDELLAYARRYVETEHERRAKKIVKKRMNDLNIN